MSGIKEFVTTIIERGGSVEFTESQEARAMRVKTVLSGITHTHFIHFDLLHNDQRHILNANLSDILRRIIAMDTPEIRESLEALGKAVEGG